MNDYPKWGFAPTYGSDDDGFSDGLIEHFTGDIDKSLAREAIQNSLDARFDESIPVTVKFRKFTIKRELIPGIDELENIFKECKNYWPEDEKVQKFFTTALAVAENEKINVLRISDFNTSGLNGSDTDKNKEWYCLVKAQGATSKQEGTKLGSFGIGKGAPFAASSFRTVFYSTFNEQEEKIFQGKARLVSHYNESEVKRGTGSYGMERQASIRDEANIPADFVRNEQGTDINILAYKGIENEWQLNLTNSVLENFWAAIHNEDLEVQIEDEIINSETIEYYLTKYTAIDNYSSPYYYYLAYTQPTKVFEQSLSRIGKCSLYILLQEKAPKRVALMRRSRMLIRTKQFRSPKPYVGIFICEDKEGNQKLKELEPPQHNDWQPKRRDDGNKIVTEIYTWIRDCLKELVISADEEISIIPGLEKWFQLPEDDEYEGNVEEAFEGKYQNIESQEETSNEINAVSENIKTKVTKRHKEQVINYSTPGKKGNKKRGRKGSPKKKRKGGGGAEEGEGNVKQIKDIDYEMRAFLLNQDDSEYFYLMNLTAKENFKGDIKILSIGDDYNYDTQLLEAKDYETASDYVVAGSKIKDIYLEKDIKNKILLKIKSKNKISINLS